MATERLDGAEKVHCTACRALQPASKRLQVYTYPRVLVLTPKRFSSGSGGGSSGSLWGRFSPNKDATPIRVEAGQLLDLSPYCNPLGLSTAAAGGQLPPRYQLLAVSHHSGCLGGGHYTAQARSMAAASGGGGSDAGWHDFNDETVSACAPPAGASSSAYVLFFRLVGTSSSMAGGAA